MDTYNVKKIPAVLVDNVTQVCEVYSMKLDKTLYKTGKDVVLTNVEGKTATISRLELMDNFLTLDGKKISMIRVKYNKRYTIMRVTRTKCVAIRVPKECKSKFIKADGSPAAHGTVLVAPISKISIDGNTGVGFETATKKSIIDMSAAVEVKDTLFRKIYSVSRLSGAVSERLKIAYNGSSIEAKDLNNETKINREAEKIEKSTQKVEKVAGKPTEVAVTKKPEAVATVVDINGNKVGYRLRAANGRVAIYSTAEVAMLAKQGKIENIKYVRQADGTEYIAGVGCSLKDLPVEPM